MDGRPLRALFIHPAYPNQFTAVAEELNRRGGFECFGLCHRSAAAADPPPFPHFAFDADGQVGPQSYPISWCFEAGMRNARGIWHALGELSARIRFDVCVGYAGFGAALPSPHLSATARVAYSELPGFQSATARGEFPITLDQGLSERGFEALSYLSALEADLCVVPSEHTRRCFPPELRPKVRVQMEGFRTDPPPRAGAAERSALGLPRDAPLVAFFGRTLEAVRGFDVFVRVAARLRQLEPAVRFLVIGDESTIYGNENAYLSGTSFKRWALARAGLTEEDFHWRPFMPYEEFRRYLACVDLAILPLIEGAANWNLFEAMAAGLPILASDRCFVPEAIRSGREGILLDPADVEGFARQARALLREPRRARLLGRAAAERVRSRFSVEAASDGYARILREAVEIHRRRLTGGELPS